MADWRFSFIVDGKHLETILRIIRPLKARELDFKEVVYERDLVAAQAAKAVKAAKADKAPKPRKPPLKRRGGKSSTDVVSSLLTDEPQQMGAFRDPVEKQGFHLTAAYKAMGTLVKEKMAEKVMIDGKPHFKKGTAS